ncbi:MAG: protein kinase [Deltaproteobacteria bacterium]|nr:protein kinase [Deltaproteobacteria bacterium]
MTLGGDRFTIVESIGSGGMGVVYRARDRLLDQDVALKTLRGGSGRDLYRFKREFRSLADLSHPNLCQLHELHTTGDEWFFTMELVAGVSFLDWVRPAAAVDDAEPTGPRGSGNGARPVRGPLLLPRLTEALPQLVDGVLALHNAGKLHRDLKPSNVLVTATGRVVLLDFGLVATVANTDRTHEAAAVGTPTYMSPEQAADQPLTAASDWYSIGVMLYEALTGRRPFEGSAQQVMVRKQTERPVPPGALEPTAPLELEQLCLALLATEPRQRPDATAILRDLGGVPSATTAGIARDAVATPFVGRAAELEVLRQAWDDARKGAVSVVVVRGESGIGKSALVREFRRRVGPEALVLVGRCYDRESVPFKALDPIVDAITIALLESPGIAASAAGPAEIVALARLFPVLRRVPAIAERTVGSATPADPLVLRARAFKALRGLLRTLSAQRPVMLAIDDMQWGDDDSAAALVELIHNPEGLRINPDPDRRNETSLVEKADQSASGKDPFPLAAPLPLLLVLIHRNDADDVVAKIITPHAAFASGAARLIALGPLVDAEARDLVVGLGAGDQTTELAIRDAHGHPMFLTELVRSPRVGGAARSVEDLIHNRLAALPAGAAEIVRVAAIASRPVPVGIALRAAGQAAQAGHLSRLRKEHLVRVHRRSDGSDPSIEPYHDRIRRGVLAELDPAAQRAIHAALASAIERAGVEDPEGLIAHWLGAGEPARAAAYALPAAAAAAEQLAFHRAAELYELAIAHGTATPEERRAIHRRHAGVLVNTGGLLRAAAAYAAAAEGAAPAERVELDRRRLEQLLRGGALREGMAVARDLLARVGYDLPSDDRRAMRALVLVRVRIALGRLRFTPRDEADLDARELERLDTLRSVATSFTFGNPLVSRLIQCQFLRAALAAGEPRRVCVALTYEIGYSSQAGAPTIPRQDRLLVLLRTWLARVPDPTIAATADIVAGIARHMSGRFREARELLEAGIAALRELGGLARWELDVGVSMWLGVLFHLGETKLIARQVPGLLRDASDRGDVFAMRALRGWRGNMAWLIVDRPTAARSHLAAATPASTEDGITVQRYFELVSGLQIDLYEGELDAAAARLEAAMPLVKSGKLLRLQSMRTELGFLRGRILVGRATDASHAPAIAREARALRKERVPWAEGYALVLDASVQRLRGETEAAVRTIGEAIGAFEACDLALMATVARWRRAALTGAAAEIEAATATMRAGAIADPAAMARMLWPWPE